MINKSFEKCWADKIPGGFCAFILNKEYPSIQITTWNNYMIEITGYSFEELSEDIFIDLLGINDYSLNSIRTFFENAYLCNDKKEKSFYILTKNNIEKAITANFSIEYKDGNYTITALVIDVTKERRKKENLEEIEVRYNKILANSSDAIFIYGDWKFIYANKKGLDMLGFDNLEDFIDYPILKTVHPDYHDIVKSRIKESHETEGSLPLLEEKFITKNGEVIDVEIQMTYIPYNGRRCNMSFARIITERKKMERDLKKSEKYFRKLFNNVNDAIYLNKVDENGLPSVYIEVNDVACTRLGYTREELRTMTPLETNPAIDIERAHDLIEKLSDNGNVLYEGLAKRKDGVISTVEINSIFLILNDEKYILSISRDISERKEIEGKLKEREQRYRQLIEALPYGVYIRTKDTLLFSNKIGLEYLGATSLDEIKGKRYSDNIKPHPSFLEIYKKNKEFIDKNGYMPLVEEKYIRTKDNKILDLEGMVIKHAYGENEDTYLVVVRDISDRKKAEALEKDMREKSKLLEQVSQYERLRTEFFANISHELRTPVNVIFSTLQLVNSNLNYLPEHSVYGYKFKNHINIMKQNCYRLIKLINNLIDVTKIDSGYFHINLINCNIISIVEDITQSVAEYITNKGISLIFDTEIEERIIACDPDKIERIMLNLISNAVKFTAPGGSLFVTIKDKGKSLTISVKDTGIGIPKDKQKIIFERFVQVDKSLARKNEGSGIGLSLVKSLVKMHKGTITVESELNKGSEFTIELPTRVVTTSKNPVNSIDHLLQEKVEKINIEFSDIYF